MPVIRNANAGQGLVVLTPTNELLTADVVHECQACLDSEPAANVVLDLQAIRCLVSGSLYPQSEPIQPLLKLQQHLQQTSRRLVVCNLTSELAKTFQILRLDKIFEIQPDLQSALASALKDREPSG